MEQLNLFPEITQETYSPRIEEYRRLWSKRKSEIGDFVYLITGDEGQERIEKHPVIGISYREGSPELWYLVEVTETHNGKIYAENFEFGGWEVYGSEREAQYQLELKRGEKK